MTRKNISDAIGDISCRHIVEAYDLKPVSHLNAWAKRAAVAACICAISAIAIVISNGGKAKNPILSWTPDFEASEYFKYCSSEGTSQNLSDVDIEYLQERSFSNQRKAMEDSGIILSMPDHPQYSCIARYNEDKSIISVTISWKRRDDVYSDLYVIAGKSEIERVIDCLYIETDGNGNVISPSVTVTERDGIKIVTTGTVKQEKTMTFQNDSGWYQIIGSYNDSYEAMAKLLDWIWENPIDFDIFAMENGVSLT